MDSAAWAAAFFASAPPSCYRPVLQNFDRYFVPFLAIIFDKHKAPAVCIGISPPLPAGLARSFFLAPQVEYVAVVDEHLLGHEVTTIVFRGRVGPSPLLKIRRRL